MQTFHAIIHPKALLDYGDNLPLKVNIFNLNNESSFSYGFIHDFNNKLIHYYDLMRIRHLFLLD